jgi:hypothetical protein
VATFAVARIVRAAIRRDGPTGPNAATDSFISTAEPFLLIEVAIYPNGRGPRVFGSRIPLGALNALADGLDCLYQLSQSTIVFMR